MATTPRTGSRYRADSRIMTTTSSSPQSMTGATLMAQQHSPAGKVLQGRRRALSSCHGASRTH